MAPQAHISARMRNNWLIDGAVFLGGLLAMLTGVYFLYLPTGGYQGGRNPAYGITVLFSRHTWEDLHTWTGVAMIVAALVHLAIHWPWVVSMARRATSALLGRGASFTRASRKNVLLNLVVATSFLLCAASGIYFLFAPEHSAAAGVRFLWSRTTWDLVHTWSGVVLGSAALLHLAIHWRWVVNVTQRLFGSYRPAPRPAAPAPLGEVSDRARPPAGPQPCDA